MTIPLAPAPGDPARDLVELLPVAHEELRGLAEFILRRRRAGNAMRTTSLVHDTYLRLARSSSATVRDRGHFLAVASRAMRCVLVDHARRDRAAKRGGGRRRVPLDEGLAPAEVAGRDVLAVDAALLRVGAIDPRKARLVELRFFGGLTIEETAEVLDVSPATVKREWTLAKAWLHREIAGDRAGGAT